LEFLECGRQSEYRRRVDAQFVVAPSPVLSEVGLHLSAVAQGSHNLS
jgi:hypothetical protein